MELQSCSWGNGHRTGGKRACKTGRTEEQKKQFIEKTLTEANKICAEYKTLFEKHRSQYIEQIIQKELNTYKAQCADIRSKIEKLDQNKPMLFGRAEWSEKRENLVQDYRQIQALYDQTKTQKKTEYLDDQRFGRKQITQYIEKNHPELSRDYAQAKDLLTKVAQFKQEQYLKERMQHICFMKCKK